MSILKSDPLKFTSKFSFLTCHLRSLVPWRFTATKMYALKVIRSLATGSHSQDLVYQSNVCTPHDRCLEILCTISEAWEIAFKTIYCRPSSILTRSLDNLSAERNPELIKNSLLDELCMFYKKNGLLKERYLKRRRWKHCAILVALYDPDAYSCHYSHAYAKKKCIYIYIYIWFGHLYQ